MTQRFQVLDNSQHGTVILEKRGERSQSCGCFSLLAGGSFQAVVWGVRTQTEPGGLTKLRDWSAEKLRWLESER